MALRVASVLLLGGALALLASACADDDVSVEHGPDTGSGTDAPAASNPATENGTEEGTPPSSPAPTPKPGATDGDDEPKPDELAIDPAQNAECKGPFNCVFPSPEAGDRNRITNPATGTKLWPIAANTDILDGIGGSRGKVTASSIQINYGQRKMLLGVPHVYAFAVGTSNGTASSWVKESAVTASLAAMPTVLARNPGKGDYEQVFTITGGDPTKYGDAKVVKDSTSNNEAATDYLVRPGKVVNVLYALPGGGGVSNDTYPLGVTFRRARGVASVYIYLYTKGTSDVIGTQRFVYGHVNGRYGWIARDALGPAAQNDGPSLTFCCAKCANREARHRVPFASECTTSATAYCAAEPSRGALVQASIGNCAP